MNRDFHYEKLVVAMTEQGRFTPEEIAAADEKLYEINEEYYKEKAIWEQEIENGIVPSESLQDIQYRHTLNMQYYFEETWGEDAWDDRHEYYALEE